MSKLKIFIIVGLIFSSIYCFLIFQHKVPFAHDTFQYLQMQYIYFNEIVQNSSIPLWFPSISQGFTGNYYLHVCHNNILSPLFSLIGLFFKDINYLYLFYFLLLFEEIFFLLGIILLSSLYYKNTKTGLFVAITLLGTSIWHPQIWWNFHFYYFIPIVLYFIHKSFITGFFRYLLFSIVFFTLVVYGNVTYYIIFISFVILTYILFLLFIDFNNTKLFLQKNLKLKNAIILLILFSIIFLSFFYVKYSINETAYIYGYRDGFKVSLDTFLTYGGSIGSGKYFEIFTRSGESYDINLYAGFFLIPFILISIFRRKEKLPVVVGSVALIIFLFSMGTFVSLFFYYVFPFGNLFRHIGLTATVFKLFIIFYAGFGFDIFLDNIKNKKYYYFILFYLFLIAVISLFEASNNLIGNAGFELWSENNPKIWQSSSLKICTKEENDVINGSSSVKLLTGNSIGRLEQTIKNFGKYKGKTLILTGWIKRENNANVNIGIYDGFTETTGSTNLPVGYYEKITIVKVINSNAKTLRVFLNIDTLNSTVIFDDIQLISQDEQLVQEIIEKVRLKWNFLVIILLIVSVMLFSLMLMTKIKREYLLNILLLIITIDLFSYKYFLIVNRMPSAQKNVLDIFKPYKYNFIEKRVNNTYSALDNDRLKQFNSIGVGLSVYNTIDSFLFIDPVNSRYRTDYVLKSIKEYFDIKNKFPNENRAYEKYSADGYPKLSVFSKLNLVENEDEIGNIFKLKNFTGDMLFTTDKDIKDIKNNIQQNLTQWQNYTNFKNQNERINANILVEEFSFNMLKLKVEVPGPADRDCFLYYSDAYHPHWNAYVNGKKMSVIKSNIGYKSVMIPYGESNVVFKFGNIIHYTSIFCSILLLSIILILTVYIFIKEILC